MAHLLTVPHGDNVVVAVPGQRGQHSPTSAMAFSQVMVGQDKV